MERLEQEPDRFEFFQAVRILQRSSRLENTDRQASSRFELGTDALPDNEPVQLTTSLSLSFPGHSVVSLERTVAADETRKHRITVGFMGLAGASGVLPTHYARLLIDRVRRGDFALRDFLDLFNHRALSLFYRAWEKSRAFVGHERALDEREGREDTFTQCLYSLLGLGGRALHPTARRSSTLRERLSFDDEVLLYFSGHYSRRPRNVASLSALLSEFLGAAIKILQFQGQWVHLHPDDQSCLPSGRASNGCNNLLGMNVVVGSRVWTGESRFRIRLGPLSHAQFCTFMPSGSRLRQLSELARLYVGHEFDFDIQPVLARQDVPGIRLGAASRLGWNTWLLSGASRRDGVEAVFRPEGILDPAVAWTS